MFLLVQFVVLILVVVIKLIQFVIVILVAIINMFIPPLRNYQNNFSKSSKNYFSNLRNIYSSPFINNYSGRKPFPDCN